MQKRVSQIKNNKICVKCEDDHKWIILENDCHTAFLMPPFDIVHAVTPH